MPHHDEPSFRKDTRAYLRFARGYCPLSKADLTLKAHKMGLAPFPFLRGSFYRWPHQFAVVADPVRGAPRLLCVGDIHLENFGTWRDADGRLAWGVNDFDEATTLPFTSDLVRLAVSAALEVHRAPGFHLGAAECADTLLEGYVAHLKFGPDPFILEDRHGWLRDLATADGAEARAFWRKLLAQEAVAETDMPEEPRDLLRGALPEGTRDVRFFRRVAGLGSLGRPRFVAVGEWCGGLTAREVKAAVPSALHMHEDGRRDPTAEGRRLAAAACRAPDPALVLRGDWVLRRLSPEARKVEIEEIEHAPDQRHLLHAMGRELANVHLGSAGGAGPLRSFLDTLPDHWLRHAAALAAERVREDYDALRRTLAKKAQA
ncbi:DUF2252 family protein [uncultured Methylobacterium sp.]|jgi:catechol 2,3-dioxygenase-like lactoylglutathione lyase family enzyme|uniref:DUF2252 family protein n=1 Tax=uncultured Methylobacterium sp. TaxID=157278 RepID=UPI0026103FCB|nr:DUF2252 family protein [uncultured Methylobacterium sp.]